MKKTSNSVPSSEDKLGTRISELSKLVGGKKNLAQMAGMSESQLYRCINGSSSPTVEPLVAIARAADASINWLATGEGPMLASELTATEQPREDAVRAMMGDEEAEARRDARYQGFMTGLESAVPVVDDALNSVGVDIDRHWRQMIAGWVYRYQFEEQHIKDLASLLGSQAELANEFALIPGYNIQVAAVEGVFPDQEQPTRKLAFRHKWLRYKGLNEKDLVLVFAKGDSMEPTINDNNTLMIDTSQRKLSDGSIYVIRTDGHLIVKRVQKLWNKGILLLSDNKEYETQQVEPSEANDLEVIGKVVWVGKDM